MVRPIRDVLGKPVHNTSGSGYAQSRGDLIKIQQVGCLCPLFLAIYHCAGDGVGIDLNKLHGEAWKVVVTAQLAPRPNMCKIN